MENVMNEETMQNVIELLSVYGLKVIGAVLILIGGRMVAGWIRGGVKRAAGKSNLDAAVANFLGNISFALVLAFTVIAALEKFGVETAGLVGVLAAMGFAVGLALQGSLSNFAAGVLLLIFRPFKPGDWVEAGGVSGSVKDIQIFNTIINSGDNIQQIVPNGQVYGAVIKNYNAYDRRRIDIVAGIGYTSDTELAMKILREIADGDERILDDPEPMVVVKELADSSVNLLLRIWVATGDYWPTTFEMQKQVKARFDAAGIEIPFPQRSIHMVQESNA